MGDGVVALEVTQDVPVVRGSVHQEGAIVPVSPQDDVAGIGQIHRT